MSRLIFISHPEVDQDPQIPVVEWGLSDTGTARAQRFAQSDQLRCVTQLWSSDERKARDTAAILSQATGLRVQTDPQLAENDRSATGFLPRDQFEAAADAFFAHPDQSFRGWETARHAQARILRAVGRIVALPLKGDVAIVSHGAVGSLLYCHCAGVDIDRRHDQPHQGHYWVAALPDLTPLHGWRSLG